MSRARRYDTALSIIMFDIDFFKKFNDKYGHLAGNFVLREFAGVLSDSIREGVDIAARFGGEEFALILPGANSDRAITVAERVRTTLEAASINFAGQPLNVTVSGGIQQFTSGMSIDDFIKNSDQALYAAKNSGRNCVKIFTDCHFEAQD